MKSKSMLRRIVRVTATPTLLDRKRMIIEAEQAEQDAHVDQSFAAIHEREYRRLTAHWPPDFEPLEKSIAAWGKGLPDHIVSRRAEVERRARELALGSGQDDGKDRLRWLLQAWKDVYITCRDERTDEHRRPTEPQRRLN